MPTTIIPINGNDDVQKQQNSLRFIELSGPSKVLDFVLRPRPSIADPKINLATAQDIDLGVSIPQLTLIVVGPIENAASIIATQLAAGKQVAFHGRAFISGEEKEVLGFR